MPSQYKVICAHRAQIIQLQTGQFHSNHYERSISPPASSPHANTQAEAFAHRHRLLVHTDIRAHTRQLTDTFTQTVAHTHARAHTTRPTTTNSLNAIFEFCVYFILISFFRTKPAKWLAVGVWVPYWKVALATVVAINRHRAVTTIWLPTKVQRNAY